MYCLAIRWKQRPARLRLWGVTVLSGAIYLAFTLPFPLHRFYHLIPPLDYAKLTHHSVLGLSAYLAGILALFGLYILGMRIIATHRINEGSWIRWIFAGAAAFGLILVFSYPQSAIDLFVYAIRTRGWALYDLPPLMTPPETLPSSDPWLGLAGEWVGAPSPYGPAWEWLSLGVYYLAGGNYLLHLIGLKLISLAAYLGCAWLVYAILKFYQPDWAVTGTAFFAWNPLVLFESVQNAHNDILMIFFLLMAIWAFARLVTGSPEKPKHLWFGVFVSAFSASVLVKFITLMVLPFFLIALALQQKAWPRRLLIFMVIGLSVAAISVLAMWPNWPGLENWAVLKSGRFAGRSLVALLILILREKISTSAAFDVVNSVIYGGLGVLYLGCLWQIWRRVQCHDRGEVTPQKNAFEAPLWASFIIFFGYVLFGVSTFHAWYLLWFIPLGACLVPRALPVSGTVVFSGMALLIIPYYETIRVWLPYLNTNHILGHLIGVGLLITPVVASLCWPLRLLPGSTQRGSA